METTHFVLVYLATAPGVVTLVSRPNLGLAQPDANDRDLVRRIVLMMNEDPKLWNLPRALDPNDVIGLYNQLHMRLYHYRVDVEPAHLVPINNPARGVEFQVKLRQVA